jgi:hypothetical protein
MRHTIGIAKIIRRFSQVFICRLSSFAASLVLPIVLDSCGGKT